MTNERNELVEKLSHFILSELATELESLKGDDDLLEDSVIDSLGIMRLIAFIEQEFDFVVPSGDVVIENFMTVNAMADYLGPQLTSHAD